MRPTMLFPSLAAVLIISLSVMAGAQSSTASTPSLGDYARAVRKAKPSGTATGKVYDNDNLPSATGLSVVGTETRSAADAKSREANGKTDSQEPAAPAAGDQKTEEKKPTGDVTTGQTAAQREQAYAVWKDKIEAQKRSVDLAARELDVVEREYRLRTAQYYADAGARLRNPAQWDDEDQKYKHEIQDKQKALESARTKLSDLEDQARRSGVPTSDRQ